MTALKCLIQLVFYVLLCDTVNVLYSLLYVLGYALVWCETAWACISQDSAKCERIESET